MAKKPAHKMPVSQRAKQFMPFSALRGLEEALAEKRQELAFCEKKLLSEDQAAAIDRRLATLHPGDVVTVTYFHHRRYEEITGAVERLDGDGGTLRLDGDVTIAIDAIADVS